MSKLSDQIKREIEDEDIRREMLAVEEELRRAVAKFKPFGSSHEGYAVLLEEVDEMWAEIKANRLSRSRAEAVQVAAMALRYLLDVRDPEAMEKRR